MRKTFIWWGVLDAGLVFNQEYKNCFYLPGDIMQAHIMIGDVEVWTEANRIDGSFRLETGSKPKNDCALSADEFIARLNAVIAFAKTSKPEIEALISDIRESL